MPPAFMQPFEGPEGPYVVDFRPSGEWHGVVEVMIGGLAMRWPVDEAHAGDDGMVLCGLTRGSEPLWNDVFWFEVHLGAQPRVIRYWGDQVLIREDRGA